MLVKLNNVDKWVKTQIIFSVLEFVGTDRLEIYFLLIGAWILEGIQKSVNPCDDFYQFACGKYIKNNPAPDTTIYRRNSEGIPFNYLTNRGLGNELQIESTH